MPTARPVGRRPTVGARPDTCAHPFHPRSPHPAPWTRWLAVALNLPAEQGAKAAGQQRVNRHQLLRSAALMGGALGGGLLGERLTYALDGRGRLHGETVSDMAAITAG
jgi:hypothetical protein